MIRGDRQAADGATDPALLNLRMVVIEYQKSTGLRSWWPEYNPTARVTEADPNQARIC